MSAHENKYWYNLDTAQVEFGQLSPGSVLIGPFDSSDDASRAPQLLRERARAWADEDAAEDGWGGASGSGGSVSRGR